MRNLENLAFAVSILAMQLTVQAQGFSVLHTFSGPDGSFPQETLVLSGNTLFGTTFRGGIIRGNPFNGSGTVFQINTDGTGFTNLYFFTAPNSNTDKNGDGFGPVSLLLSGNTLFGTTHAGGTNNGGTVFALNTNGTGFTTLYNGSVQYPDVYALSGNTLYGQIDSRIAAINTNGTDLTPLYSGFLGPSETFLDGLILSGNTLYGRLQNGGILGAGLVFAFTTGGTDYAEFYSFTNGNDGAIIAGLILSGNTLYAIASTGGSNGSGTVFALNTDGTGFRILYSFRNRTLILLPIFIPTVTGIIRWVLCYRATLCLGQPFMAAQMDMARYSH
jgi:uncharacterized repeat protein (TIGR03803 family)